MRCEWTPRQDNQSMSRELSGAPNDSWFSPEQCAQPLAGYIDAASRSSIELDIECCELYGVDGLIFNYYSNSKVVELSGPLDEFLVVDSDIRFAINICCRMPRRRLRFGSNQNEEFEPNIVLSEGEYNVWRSKSRRDFLCRDVTIDGTVRR